MPNFYPSSLASFITRLSGFSKSTIRLFPQNQTTATSYQQITLTLPPNQLIDPNSICLNAKLTTSGTTADNTQDFSCVLPPAGIESLITSVSVSANGQLLAECRNYNQIFNILADLTLGNTENDRAVMNLGRWNPGKPKGTTTVLDQNNSAVPLVDTEVCTLQSGTDPKMQPYRANALPVSKWNWLGFLNSSEILDVDMIGDLRITLTLAGSEVLVQQNIAPGTAKFQLDDIYMTCDTLLLPSEYFAAQSSYLNGDPSRVIRRKFDNWSVNPGPMVLKTQTPTQQTRMTLNSDSVDMLIGTFHNATVASTLGHYNESSHLPVAGKSTGTVDAFQRNGYSVKDWQMNINGTAMPQYRVPGHRSFWFASSALGAAHCQMGQISPYIRNIDRFTQGHWVAAITLAPSADPESRLVAGYSCRNTNAVFTWETTGDGTYSSQDAANGGIGYAGMDRLPTVYAKCSSVLQIQAGRLCSVIY